MGLETKFQLGPNARIAFSLIALNVLNIACAMGESTSPNSDPQVKEAHSIAKTTSAEQSRVNIIPDLRAAANGDVYVTIYDQARLQMARYPIGGMTRITGAPPGELPAWVLKE